MAEVKRRRKRKRLPEAPFTATIESLSNEGRGIVHVDDRLVFVDQALAGETVTARYTRYTQKLTEARTESVEQASADRVEAKCHVFGTCGGCSLQHMSHAAQLELKQNSLLEQLERLGNVRPQTILPPLQGPVWQYRHKARLGVRWVEKKQTVLVGFRERGSSFITHTERCEILHPVVGPLIAELAAVITRMEARQHIPQIEVAAGDDDVVLVFRHLKPLSASDRELLVELGSKHNLIILLQAGKPDDLELLYPEQVTPLHYDIDGLRIEFAPGDFTQVNPEINRAMLQQALELLDPQADDTILDLFCGLGNFSLPIAKRCQQVTAVEGSDSMVKKARANAELNNIDNVSFICADLYSDTVTLAPWMKQHYDRVLLDPPRSGAAQVIPLLAKQQAPRIVYISCHPGSLARDAGMLVNDYGYTLTTAGIMDMFPHTAHVESIAVFDK